MPEIDFEPYASAYFVTPSRSPGPLFEIGLAGLLEKEGADAFITAYVPQIKALSRDVAATYFASWYGRICSAHHYALWKDAAVLDLANDRVTLQMIPESRRAGLVACLQNTRTQDAGEPAAIREALEDFYGNQARPLLEAMARAGGVNPGVLWGMIATNVYYFHDVWRKQAESCEEKERLQLVADLLFGGLPAEVFGRARSPFDIKFSLVDNPREPGSLMRVKASCCLAYKTDTGHGYCYTCPRMTAAEREQMREELAAAAR